MYVCVYITIIIQGRKKHEFERNEETMEKFEEGERKNNINIFLFLIILRKYMA